MRLQRRRVPAAARLQLVQATWLPAQGLQHCVGAGGSWRWRVTHTVIATTTATVTVTTAITITITIRCRGWVRSIAPPQAGCAQFFPHILCRLDQFRPLADQGMAAARLRRVDGAGDGKHLAPQLQGLVGGDQRAR